jgi:hypothetical protein
MNRGSYLYQIGENGRQAVSQELGNRIVIDVVVHFALLATAGFRSEHPFTGDEPELPEGDHMASTLSTATASLSLSTFVSRLGTERLGVLTALTSVSTKIE